MRCHLLVALLLISTLATCQTITVSPVNPNSSSIVQIIADAYYGIYSETHSRSGNFIKVRFVEGIFDLGPNPDFPPLAATIGRLPAGTYNVDVEVANGISASKFYPFQLYVVEMGVGPPFPSPNAIPAVGGEGLLILVALISLVGVICRLPNHSFNRTRRVRAVGCATPRGAPVNSVR